MKKSISASITDLGRPVSYYPSIARVLDDVKAGIFLCQFRYWEGKQHDPDGWIYKTRKEIEEETGLSRYEQEHARKRLQFLGIMEEELKGIPASMAFRFNWTAFDELFNSKTGKQELEDKLERGTREHVLKTLTDDEQWVEIAMMQVRITNRKAFEKYLQKFLIEAASKEQLGKQLREIKGYFINWSKYNPPDGETGGTNQPYL